MAISWRAIGIGWAVVEIVSVLVGAAVGVFGLVITLSTIIPEESANALWDSHFWAIACFALGLIPLLMGGWVTQSLVRYPATLEALATGIAAMFTTIAFIYFDDDPTKWHDWLYLGLVVPSVSLGARLHLISRRGN